MEQTKNNFVLKLPVTEKRFFIFFLWTSLIPLVLLFVAGYYTTTNLLHKQAVEKHVALVEKKHSELKLFIEKIRASTAAWSTDGKIRELVQKINDGSCKKNPPSTICPTASELSYYLTKYKLPLLEAVGIIDILNVDGIIIASSDVSRIGTDESKEQVAFSETLLLPFGQATFFPELISEEDEFEGRMMVHLTAPVASTDNSRLVGVLLAHSENKELNIVIAESSGLTTESFIVNKDKLLVTPSRFIPDAVLKQEINTPPVNECIQHGMPYSGTYTDYRGIEVISASVCDTKYFGTHIVKTDKGEVFSEIDRLRNTASAILVVVLALLLIYAYLSGADIVRGARHIFPSTISSGITLGIVIGIIIAGTAVISYTFTKNIEQFIIDQKTDAISSLVSQQANRHINRSETSAFIEWETPLSQKKFQDFGEEILYSFQSVVAVQMHTTSGILVWSSLQKAEIGTTAEEDEVSETLRTGKITRSSASDQTISELGVPTLIGVYVPILGKNGDITGVAETYVNTGDIATFTQNIQRVLWIGTSIALILIFSLLRYVFRKQDAKIVEQSEELRGVIEQSPIGIYTVKKDGTIDTYNPAMAHESGIHNVREIIGKNIFEIEDYRSSGLDNLIREGLNGNSFRKEIEIRASGNNDKKTYHDYYGVPLKNTDGVIDQLLLMALDITPRKKLEEAIRGYTRGLEEKVTERTKEIEEAKAKAEALLASLGEGMIATDNDGRIITINRVAEQILKWTEPEILGKKIVDVIPAVTENDDIIPPEERAYLTAATRGNMEVRSGKMYFIRKDGYRVPVAVTATPVIIDDENTGAVIIFRDITSENELEKTRRDLLTLASHQLRTPLSGTKWLIETLKKGIHGTLTKNQEEYLNEIYKINERMTTLVHDMLSVLRMEGDTTSAKKERVSLTTLFGALFEVMHGVAESKRISLQFNKVDEYVVETDALLLRNVLESITSNAINYSTAGSSVVINVEKNDFEIIFSVKDHGIGIPQEEQRQIFQRFYRASNAKTFDTHGTGLGLYIAATLAKKIGATLSFESEVGKGSTFYVHLPARA